MSEQGRRRGRTHPGALLALALAAFVLFVAALEVGFRIAGFDFEFKRRAFEAIPIFFRQPVVATGGAFFRRPGPDRWEGRVLTPMMRRAGVPATLIPDEAAVAITYDRLGFRNPSELDDWEIVVVGDSSTELGFLPYSDLYTTKLGELLSLRVKNLAVSWTGPFTYVHYLEEYGGAASARIAVLAFFEGNDLHDLIEEQGRMAQARRGRKVRRVSRLESLEPQSSLLVAAWRLIRRSRSRPVEHLPDADFEADGARIPVSMGYRPPGTQNLSAGQRLGLERALRDWARVARQLGMEPWLLYLPTKRRVLHGSLVFHDYAPREMVEWQPTDLPEWVQGLAERAAIGFVDATPALRSRARAGRLPFNGVYDSHLNREGAQVVAEVLARALRPALGSQRTLPPGRSRPRVRNELSTRAPRGRGPRRAACVRPGR